MRKLVAISLFVLISCGLAAQQEPQFNLWMFHKVAINPAVAGVDRMISTAGYFRDQWIGYKNEDGTVVNPLTFGVSFDMPVYKISSGAGLTVMYNKTGAESNLDIKLHYAYLFTINKKHTISAGLSLGFLSKSIDYSKVTPSEEDPMISGTKESGFMTDIDFGLHYQYMKKFYVGLSATNLLGSKAEIGAPEFDLARHFYVFGGYDIMLRDERSGKLVLTPAVMLRATTGAMNLDFDAILTYNDLYWGGIMYRTSNAIGLMGGINYQGFKVGLSYDYTMSKDFAKGDCHSLELVVRYSYAIYPPIVKRSGYNTRNM
jgi:type IX secretion system PorP/SprF family membrane protein